MYKLSTKEKLPIVFSLFFKVNMKMILVLFHLGLVGFYRNQCHPLFYVGKLLYHPSWFKEIHSKALKGKSSVYDSEIVKMFPVMR